MNEKCGVRGWVYVISNPGLSNLVKIGFTMKDPEVRAKELRNTGNPYSYTVDYEVFCKDPRAVEAQVHTDLTNMRADKEWFGCTVQEAVSAIRKVIGKGAYYEKTIEFQPIYKELTKPLFVQKDLFRGNTKVLKQCHELLFNPDPIRKLIVNEKAWPFLVYGKMKLKSKTGTMSIQLSYVESQTQILRIKPY